MADSAKESKDNKRKRGAAAKKEKDREKDRPPPAPPMQDIKLPEKYRLLPVPKADAANAQSDHVVQLSRTAKAPQITLQEDMLTAIGCKGYRMVRATHGVGSGSWYFEVRVNTPLNGEDGHTRLGWCTDMGELQAPVGYDHNSYAYRDRVANAAIGSPGSTFHPNPNPNPNSNPNPHTHTNPCPNPNPKPHPDQAAPSTRALASSTVARTGRATSSAAGLRWDQARCRSAAGSGSASRASSTSSRRSAYS